MKNIIIADNQDITQAGIAYVLSKRGNISCQVARNKSELILLLNDCPEAVVILDYTLFDISSESDLLNIGQRFPLAHLILWSEELSVDFIRHLVNASNWISVLMKDAKMAEIEQCLDYVLQGQRFLCQHATNMILAPTALVDKEIALGATTREIAEKRFSSFHTVNTHRKNIFRKLGVNNVHEAIRYAMRSGLVDATEYYI